MEEEEEVNKKKEKEEEEEVMMKQYFCFSCYSLHSFVNIFLPSFCAIFLSCPYKDILPLLVGHQQTSCCSSRAMSIVTNKMH